MQYFATYKDEKLMSSHKNDKNSKRKLRPRKGKGATQKVTQTRKAYVEPDELRLNKFIANCGVCSRREADELISSGRIKVNGKTVDTLGSKVQRSDKVSLDGQSLNISEKSYIILNKPKDHITTTNDPKGRKTVMDLIQDTGSDRLYPVGRLDRNTTGVLLFTNDGLLAQRLIHPKRRIKKIYAATLDKPLKNSDLGKIAEGLELEDGWMKVDQIAYVDPADQTKIGIEIHSGKNRIVRRLFEALDYDVVSLDRVIFAGLDKLKLGKGKWRKLTDKELKRLKSVAGMV